jgi:hypothetical protein
MRDLAQAVLPDSLPRAFVSQCLRRPPGQCRLSFRRCWNPLWRISTNPTPIPTPWIASSWKMARWTVWSGLALAAETVYLAVWMTSQGMPLAEVFESGHGGLLDQETAASFRMDEHLSGLQLDCPIAQPSPRTVYGNSPGKASFDSPHARPVSVPAGGFVISRLVGGTDRQARRPSNLSLVNGAPVGPPQPGRARPPCNPAESPSLRDSSLSASSPEAGRSWCIGVSNDVPREALRYGWLSAPLQEQSWQRTAARVAGSPARSGPA